MSSCCGLRCLMNGRGRLLRARGMVGRCFGRSLVAALICGWAFAAPAAAMGRADDEKTMVAVYDGGGVSVEEFKLEFQRAAAKYADADMTAYKAELLANMVTNELLTAEAKERGFIDELGVVDPKIIKDKEKAMVNQLRRDFIVKGVTVGEQETKDLYDKSNIRRLTRTISVSNKEDADRIAKELAAGADFVELAKDWSLDTGSASWDAILAWVKIGDGPEEVENLLLELKLGEVGDPLLAYQGYYFFRVDSLYHKEDLASFEELRPLLRSKILARKRTPVTVAYMDSVAAARGVKYNEETIAVVVDRFGREGWVQDDEPGRASVIPHYEPSELAMPAFSFDGGSRSLEEYLKYVEDMHINPAYYLAGREEMERGLGGLARQELELHLAYEMGMDKVRSVRGHVREKAARKGIVDLLVDVAGGEESARTTDAQRLVFYEDNKWKYTEPGAIVISVLTVTDREAVDQLYEDVKNGMPFSEVVENYRWVIVEDRTKERIRMTEEDKENNPEIFDTARRMKAGSVSEPIPLPGKLLSVITLLEREPSTILPYEEVKEEVMVDLNLQILNAATEKIEEYKKEIREKYHYKVNEEVLAGIQL